jgi:hypothetical protein
VAHRALGPHLDAGAAERDVDRPHLVGPQNGRSGILQPDENLARRMAVVVAHAHRDRRHAGLRRLDQRDGRGCPAPVMADLQQVHDG